MNNQENLIDKTITIEELVRLMPSAVRYLSEKGIRCIVCGEPIWGTLEEAVLEKGFTHEDLSEIVNELNRMRQS